MAGAPPPDDVTSREPLVVAPVMGYGHLRAGESLADGLGVPLRRLDRPPICAPGEVLLWRRLRRLYEALSRFSQMRGPLGLPARKFLDWITIIEPLDDGRDLSAPTRSAHTLERFLAQGFNRQVVERVALSGAPLVSTFYSSAIAGDRVDLEHNFCVVTDSDINRAWAPMRARHTRIRYVVPSRRVARRLEAYGVPAERIEYTGFPLPPSLVGDGRADVLRRNLAARLARLDPTGDFRRTLPGAEAARLPLPSREESGRPPLVTFAVGGAGAQAAIAKAALPRLAPALRAGRLRLALVAGMRRPVADRFRRWVQRADVEGSVEILCRRDFRTYYDAFNELLARTDVLWTKPSELVFYAALGLPLVLSEPVGFQEYCNHDWVTRWGAGVPQGRARRVDDWLLEWMQDGSLAAAAWQGFTRLPHDGTRRIARLVEQAAR